MVEHQCLLPLLKVLLLTKCAKYVKPVLMQNLCVCIPEHPVVMSAFSYEFTKTQVD